MNLQPETKNVVLYFQVHQPRRLRHFRFFDIGTNSDYFDDIQNKEIMERVATRSYLPVNALLLKLVSQYPQIKVSFSISGVALDQMKQFTPEVVESFRSLASTSSVEFLGETDQHSLASLMPGEEFEMQVLDHSAKLLEYFGVRPSVFRNTELIYNNDVARRVEALGFNGIFTDGVEQILGKRSPHHLYRTPEGSMNVFLRNYRLSDDIAFRFVQDGGLLTVEKYISWLDSIPQDQNLVVLAMDYETFGEHQRSAGILKFLEELLITLGSREGYRMLKPSEAIDKLEPHDTLNVLDHISWADSERDISAWLGNDMQIDAFSTLIKMEPDVRQLEDPKILERWRWLQTSDHFYYMSTKRNDDGNVHAYFSPYNSPYEAFINYMNVLHDFAYQLKEATHKKQPSLESSVIRVEAERRELHIPDWALKIPSTYHERH
jgi:alpha-amylase